MGDLLPEDTLYILDIDMFRAYNPTEKVIKYNLNVSSRDSTTYLPVTTERSNNNSYTYTVTSHFNLPILQNKNEVKIPVSQYPHFIKAIHKNSVEAKRIYTYILQYVLAHINLYLKKNVYIPDNAQIFTYYTTNRNIPSTLQHSVPPSKLRYVKDLIEKAFRPLRTKFRTHTVTRLAQMTSAVYNSIVEAWNRPVDDLSHSLVRGALRKFTRSLAINGARSREASLLPPAPRSMAISWENETLAAKAKALAPIEPIIEKARKNRALYDHDPALKALYTLLNTTIKKYRAPENISKIQDIALEIESHKPRYNDEFKKIQCTRESSCAIAGGTRRRRKHKNNKKHSRKSKATRRR